MYLKIIPLYKFIPINYRIYFSLNYLLAQKMIVTKENVEKINIKIEKETSLIHNNRKYLCRGFFSCIGRETSHII